MRRVRGKGQAAAAGGAGQGAGHDLAVEGGVSQAQFGDDDGQAEMPIPAGVSESISFMGDLPCKNLLCHVGVPPVRAPAWRAAAGCG